MRPVFLRPAVFPRRVGSALALLALAASPVRSEHFDSNLVATALARADESVARIIAVPDDERTFENTLDPIDALTAQVELDTNMYLFQAYVSPDARVREEAQAGEELVREWFIELAKNEDLYRAVKAYADTKPELEGERARYLNHTLRDYRRAGMELPEEKRDELKEIQKEIARLSIEFDENIREDETRVPFTAEELVGMPDDYLAGLTKVGDVYLVGLSYPEFFPLQDLCENETTRKKIWITYKRRGGTRNVGVLERMVAKRAEAARLLEYGSTAAYEVETKMAKTPDAVEGFYAELRPLVRRKAKRDYAEFVEAKRRHTGDPEAELEPWDYSFYKNLLLREKYAVDSEKVREYFPLEKVTNGLFSITQAIYEVEYEEITESARDEGRFFWHEDVRLFEVRDRASGDVIGEFYIDLHPRPGKYGHAAQWGLAQHRVWADGSVTRPLAALVCNFTKPTAEKPSLLTHEEVETYFHEFGHCLHTLLSEAELFGFAGTGVERDFVEAPSQILENWIWDADVLATFAAHYETEEILPRSLLDGMIRARHLGSGLEAERQFFYGIYDFTLHSDPEGDLDSTELGHELWGRRGEGVELYGAIPETHFQAAFGHLTGYQAGYYGYQWSLVYAADMFQRFREMGMLDPEAGMHFRKAILARGGTLDGLDLVKDYLGRDPDMTAYLEHLGLDEVP